MPQVVGCLWCFSLSKVAIFNNFYPVSDHILPLPGVLNVLNAKQNADLQRTVIDSFEIVICSSVCFSMKTQNNELVTGLIP